MRDQRVLALDLEGTLISNAMSIFPRPGLAAFLEFCKESFSRVVLFTAVSTIRVHAILDVLVDCGDAPYWFKDVEIIEWSGEVKDLSFIPHCLPQKALLVDDIEAYVHPDQKSQWVSIPPFNAPYSTEDDALPRLTQRLQAMLDRAN